MRGDYTSAHSADHGETLGAWNSSATTEFGGGQKYDPGHDVQHVIMLNHHGEYTCVHTTVNKL